MTTANAKTTAPKTAAKRAPKAKPAAPAVKAAKAVPKPVAIKLLDKKFTYGGEGTVRRASWMAATKSKTVTEYKANGGLVKYLARFAAAKAIALV